MSRIYYFGCAGRSGHVLWKPWQVGYMPMRPKREEQADIPWNITKLDGELQPQRGQEIQGRCALHHKNGWTAMAFWDRSMDTRFSSCSVIIKDAKHSFDEMVVILREHFPDVWKRITTKFELVLTGDSIK